MSAPSAPWVLGLLLAVAAPPALGAQESGGALVSKAIELEGAGRNREAVAAWRAAIAGGAVLPGVLGLERVFSMLGEEDSVLVVIDSLLPHFPREPQLRSAQLRTYVALGRDAEAAAAFRAWRDSRPGEVAPYRDFARVLLFNNRASSADTVLREAVETLGSSRVLLLELAQLRAALGRWRDAAEAWRETMRDQPYFEAATVFSLSPAPVGARDSIRVELRAPGTPLGAIQSLALLELGWGAPREGWRVLAPLWPSDTAIAIWTEFAGEAERAQAWSTMRDALLAVHRARPGLAIALRTAVAALRANDAETALELARTARERADTSLVRAEILPVELEALARLGRAAEAEWVLAAAALGRAGERAYARTIAWAWIRAGNVVRARAVLADAPLDAEDAVAGWLALFDGDLAAARPALRYSESFGAEAVTVLAFLSRTRATRAPAAGAAFLALARADSVASVREFRRAAAELTDAAPLLLAMAARIEIARGANASGIALWERVATAFADAPEAPEARLELGRAFRAQGDVRGARAQFEQLILAYPSSALVPQARRELDALPPLADGR
ncbi:MAG: tetratricopeptide repeat protein [Gemmatimonadaceae bacterium]